jgi:predicted nucleotidyltransferase
MEAKDKVYSALYEERNRWLYFSELKIKTGLSNSSLQNVLKKLEKEGELEKEKKTSNIFFRIRPNKKPVVFSRIDIKKFEELNLGVRVPLKNWLSILPPEIGFVILFGSASRKKEKDGSDIDLLVVLHSFSNKELQNLYEKEIKQKITVITKNINSESNYPLKVVFVDRDSFKISKDHLIVQAKETGFPIFGISQYYKNEEN